MIRDTGTQIRPGGSSQQRSVAGDLGGRGASDEGEHLLTFSPRKWGAGSVLWAAVTPSGGGEGEVVDQESCSKDVSSGESSGEEGAGL